MVVNLAESNCLDPTDPDMDNDDDLLREAHRQWAAVDTVNAFLSLLDSASDKNVEVLVTVG